MKEKAEQILTVFETRLTKIPIALPEMMGAYIVQQLGVKQVGICLVNIPGGWGGGWGEGYSFD